MMRRDRTAGLQELIEELSAHNLKMVPSWASMVPTVLLSHPDAVRAVLTADYAVVPKNLLTQVFFAPWLGEGLLTGGGSKWKRSRRLLTPVRQRAMMKAKAIGRGQEPVPWVAAHPAVPAGTTPGLPLPRAPAVRGHPSKALERSGRRHRQALSRRRRSGRLLRPVRHCASVRAIMRFGRKRGGSPRHGHAGWRAPWTGSPLRRSTSSPR